MKILIKNGIIVNPDKNEEADILIAGGVVKKISKNIKEECDKTIDAKGKHVMPAFIDMHAHLRTPGREDEEDFETGSIAAAKGGFATIFCMPNTAPCIDSEGIVGWVIEEAKKVGLISIFPIAAVTKERKGEKLTEFGALKSAGVIALSDDGDSIESSAMARKAFEYAKTFDLLIISHCEDTALSANGAIREGVISTKYGINAIPDIAETLIAFRNIALAEYIETRIHVAHTSCEKTLGVIRDAKKRAAQVTCETAPHYFVLTVDDIEKNKFDSNFKVNPPLGETKDVEAVKQALKDGTIDCIATDHAPHSVAEKELPFESAPFGFIGLELAFSLSYQYLVKAGVLTLNQLVQKLSSNPAKILGIEGRGKIEIGSRADITIVDLNKSWEVKKETLASKSKNTPFLGSMLSGVVEYTFHKGKIAYKNKV